MHPNPQFRRQTEDINRAYAQERAFGILAVSGPNGPVLSHVPFLLEGNVVGLHLVRSNPIARLLQDAPIPARIAVSGPDSYISPDWYGVDDQVPTWNYIAVHLTGMLELRPQDEMRDLLDRQSEHFEDQLQPKTPWTTEKMTPEVRETMMRQIVPCRMNVTAIDGTWKLNQNKPDEVRLTAAQQVEAYGMGSEIALLAALMRGA